MVWYILAFNRNYQRHRYHYRQQQYQWHHKGWCHPGRQLMGVTLFFSWNNLTTFLVTFFGCCLSLPTSHVVYPVFFLNSETKNNFRSDVTPLEGVTRGGPPSDATEQYHSQPRHHHFIKSFYMYKKPQKTHKEHSATNYITISYKSVLQKFITSQTIGALIFGLN